GRRPGSQASTYSHFREQPHSTRFALAAGNTTGHFDQLRFPAPMTLAGEAIRVGHPVVVDDYRRHPMAHPVWLEAGVRAVLAVPIFVDGKAIAAITAYTVNRPLRFRHAQIAIIEGIAQQAGAL